VNAEVSAPLWGISEVLTLDGPQSFAMSFEDFEADVASANDILESVGAGRGDSILALSTFAESGVYTPVFAAAWRRRVIVSCAEATAPDAYRVALLMRVLPRLRAVVGVNGAVLDGLEAARNDVGDVFTGAAIIGARPAAWGRLTDAGVPARLLVQLGPALAIECAERVGAHVSPTWHVEADAHGLLRVEPVVARACGTQRWQAVGRWVVVEQPCACGRTGQRVEVRR
jgi:hypothetical protein